MLEVELMVKKYFIDRKRMRKSESQKKFVILIEKRWIPHQAKENGKDEGENTTTGSKKID